MKIPAAFTTLFAVLLALAPVARTHAQDAPPPPGASAPGASFDLFYNNLADDGDWYNTPEYGYVWQPYIAGKNPAWRPYSDGYWAVTDDGWTWVSYESFGWATYHYGRWTRLNDLGWAWVPGYDWGPGWVSWRSNEDYVGWAPLPPQAESAGVAAPGVNVSVDYNTVEDEAQGYTPAVDAQFDIGPQNYCFVDVRNFGAPVLSEVLLPPQQNVVILTNTVNITNIYYGHEGGRTVVYNRGGPDINFISTRVAQPIQHLQLQQNVDPNYLRGNHPAGFNPTQVHNGVLQVAAPAITRGPVNFQQVKPPRVKATLPKAEVVHGWSGAAGDPQVIQQARQTIKQQAQAVPRRQPNGNIALPAIPPSRGQAAARPPGTAPSPAAPQNPAVNGAPHQPLTDAEKQARRQQRANGGAPKPTAAPAVAAPTERPEAPREARPTPEPKAAAPREEERAPEPKADPKATAPRQEERAAEPKAEPKATAPRQEERAVEPKAEPKAAAPRQEEHAVEPKAEPKTTAPREAERAAEPKPEPKATAPREQERAPEPKPAPKATPREQERAARPEAARRDEAAAKQSDDDNKKKKKDQPQ